MPLLPTPGNDILNGSPLADLIAGFDGDDVLRGGAGDDVFFEGWVTWGGKRQKVDGQVYLRPGQMYNFGLGNDVINGGDGFDVVDYGGRLGGVRLDLAQGLVALDDETDQLSNIEQIKTSNGADNLLANAAGYSVLLRGGDDLAVVTTGGSYLSGGKGRDTLNFQDLGKALKVDLSATVGRIGRNDQFSATGFEVVLGVSGHENDLTGNARSNLLQGGTASDRIDGGAGNDVLLGGGGGDHLNGGDGRDAITGGEQNDYIEGGAGNDLIYAGGGEDHIQGGDGADVIYGEAGNDTIWGDEGPSKIFGGAGEDILHGWGLMRGGDGWDTLYVSGFGRFFGEGGRDSFEIQRGAAAFVHGGGGVDRFNVTGQGEILAAINGGDGKDILITHGGVINVNAWPSRQAGDVTNVEYIISQSGLLVAVVEQDNVSIEVQGGRGQVVLAASGNTAYLGGRNDVVGVSGYDSVVYGNGGADQFEISYGSGAQIFGGAGADSATVNTSAHVELEDGNDQLFLNGFGPSDDVMVWLGAGADRAELNYQGAELLDLGSGDDQVQIYGQVDGLIVTGSGADQIVFDASAVNVDLTIGDLDVRFDRLSIDGVSGLDDLVSVVESADGVLLSFGADFERSTVMLNGVFQADLSDDLFF